MRPETIQTGLGSSVRPTQLVRWIAICDNLIWSGGILGISTTGNLGGGVQGVPSELIPKALLSESQPLSGSNNRSMAERKKARVILERNRIGIRSLLARTDDPSDRRYRSAFCLTGSS